MSRHRGDIGGALLVSAIACWIGAVTAGATGARSVVIILVVGGALCLCLALWAFEAWGDLAGGVVRARRTLASIPRRIATRGRAPKPSPFDVQALGMLRNSALARPKRGPPVVTGAYYGAGSRTADVTQRVKAMVDAGGMPFVVDNETLMDGGDPAPGARKKLAVTYVRLGGPLLEGNTVTFVEGQSVNRLP